MVYKQSTTEWWSVECITDAKQYNFKLSASGKLPREFSDGVLIFLFSF